MPQKSLKLLTSPPPNPKPTVADEIYNDLRQRIVSLELPQGAHLVESDIARFFGASNTPVREALGRLVVAGLADRTTHRGVRVHVLTRDEIIEIWELRALLEPHALHSSAASFTPERVAGLRRLLEQAAEALKSGDRAKLSTCNGQFHMELVCHCPNRLLNQWMSAIADRRRIAAQLGWLANDRAEIEWQQHMAILESIEVGDFDQAKERLTDHLREFAQRVISRYEPRVPQDADPQTLNLRESKR